ncbi:Transposase, IS4 family [Sphingobium yanoikuyae]|uniref:Transposase, IS4 family n=1 Tax=Sphingobium yanoikuyae TaxID=13690 RepID=A0A084E292_SPHYA|nr:Transposase, IS4 family [Sphingobium yanoikuyae]
MGSDPHALSFLNLHIVCDGKGRPLVALLSKSHMSDYKVAALMLDALLRAKALFGD